MADHRAMGRARRTRTAALWLPFLALVVVVAVLAGSGPAASGGPPVVPAPSTIGRPASEPPASVPPASALVEPAPGEPVPVAQPSTPRRRDNPDPFVLADGDRLLLYSTQGRSNVPLRTSTDWQTWGRPVDVLPVLPGWAQPGRTWAPAVLRVGDGWVLYFTAWHAESGRQCIGSATAPTPEGPFSPVQAPTVCQLDLGGSIDPSPYREATGTYLLWKSDENAIGRPARLWAAPLTADATQLAGAAVPLLEADHAWEQPLIENPAMVTGEDGRRWLFYSAGAWDTDRYSTGLAACDGPLGPCRKLAHDEAWLASTGDLRGPGGLDTFVSADGELLAALHAWDPDAIGYRAGGQRSVRIGHLDLGGPTPTFWLHGA